MAPNIETTTSNRRRLVRQLLGVALDEFDFQFFVGGAFAGLFQKIGGNVEADDLRSCPGGGNGLIPRAASHVQHFRSTA